MKLAAWMAGGSVLGAWLVTLVPGVSNLEVWLGMLAPTAVTSGEWIATERKFRQAPESLSSLMLRMFIAKAVLFAVYVGVLLMVGRLEPGPFVVSFMGFFLVLFVVEAIALYRLGRKAPSGQLKN